MSTNKLELQQITQLIHTGKVVFPVPRLRANKACNVRGATVSASVQLFISSFLTHSHILMRWHSSSRIRTVGSIIVCLSLKIRLLSALLPGCVQWKMEILVGVAHAYRLSILVPQRPSSLAIFAWAPTLLLTGLIAFCNFVSLSHGLCFRRAWRFSFASPFPKIVPGVQWALHKC